MKIVAQEPFQVGMLPTSFDPPAFVGCFIAKAAFQLKPGGIATPLEEPEGVSGDVYVDDDLAKALLYPSDFVPKKARVDVVLLGTAHAPGKAPLPQLDVGLRLGPIAKTLRIFGKRPWKQGLLGRSPGGPAELFALQPLGYEFAIGGTGSKLNPVGMGLEGDEMPRIEDPKSLLTKPRADAPPGFGPIPLAWPQRFDHVGSYRGNYVKERWPWFPTDFDFAAFNAAPRDQQIEGALKGDEEIVLENLHPEHSTYRSRLPGLRLRMFAKVRQADVFQLREIPVRLDTVWIDMSKEKLVLVWRGHMNVSTPKMREIANLLVWTEPLTEKPKPIEHYEEVLAANLASQIEPAEPPEPPDEADDGSFDASFAAMDKEFAGAEASLGALAADAEKAIAKDKLPVIATPKSPADELRAVLASAGDLIPDQVASLEAMIAEIDGAEAEFAAMDKEFAAAFPEEPTADDLLSGKAGPPPYMLDGMDLSGRDLTKLDLRGSSLMKANLAGANLAGVRLDKADLTRADLSGANLTGAFLNDADLTEANVEGVKIAGASLVNATLSKLKLAGVDLTGCDASKADFSGSSFAGAKLERAKFVSADLSDCILEGADARSADFTRTLMSGVKAAKANFEGANWSHAAANENADLTGANLRGIQGIKSVFESAILDRADFSRAILKNAQFGEASLVETNFDRCDLTGASFDDANATGCKLTRANLLRASFERTDLTGANLEGSNAYEAGFWLTKTKDVRLAGTNVRKTLLD